MTRPDPKRAKPTIRLRRSAGGGQPAKWEVTYDGKSHTVIGTEDDARARLRELSGAAHPER